MTGPPTPAEACVGCGGIVPKAAGPTHPYMRASPGCWQIYGEVGVRLQGDGDGGRARWHHVDAYAVQHPGGAEHDRRQRQSVAVHLITLCLLFERHSRPPPGPARRGSTSQVVLRRLGLVDWPFLEPPRHLGAVSVADVHAARTPAEQERRADAWLESAWAAWSAHHPTVRTWAATMQEAHR